MKILLVKQFPEPNLSNIKKGFLGEKNQFFQTQLKQTFICTFAFFHFFTDIIVFFLFVYVPVSLIALARRIMLIFVSQLLFTERSTEWLFLIFFSSAIWLPHGQMWSVVEGTAQS